MPVECQVLAQFLLWGGDYFRRFVVAFLCLLVAILPFVAALTLTVLVPTLRVCAFRFTKPFKKPIFFSIKISVRFKRGTITSMKQFRNNFSGQHVCQTILVSIRLIGTAVFCVMLSACLPLHAGLYMSGLEQTNSAEQGILQSADDFKLCREYATTYEKVDGEWARIVWHDSNAPFNTFEKKLWQRLKNEG